MCARRGSGQVTFCASAAHERVCWPPVRSWIWTECHIGPFVSIRQHAARTDRRVDPRQGFRIRGIENERTNISARNQTNRNLTMSLPVDISFQDVPHSEAVEEVVITRANRLIHIRGDLVRCRVSLALGAKHQHQGRPFDVNVHVFTPHRTHVSSNSSNEDAYIALHEAFTHVERMLVEAKGKRSPQP